MRKQGFMKRVLGGIMAVAFGAALCFAAPVKAEAATPWTSQVQPNDGERWSKIYAGWAEEAALAAQQNVRVMNWALSEQLGAETNIAQTRMATQQYMAAFNVARQAASMLPKEYRDAMYSAIGLQRYNLREEAIGYIDGQRYRSWEMGETVKMAQWAMERNLKAQQQLLVGSQAAALAGAYERAVDAQWAAMQDAAIGMYRQVQAAYDKADAVFYSGYNYGF